MTGRAHRNQAVLRGWRSPAGRAVAAVVAAALGALGLVAVATAPGYTQVRVGLVSGQAWVASSPRGEAVLLDGSTDDVVARVTVAAPGAPLRLVQSGADAVVANLATGQVSRVSAARQTVVPGSTAEVIPGARAGLSLVGGGSTDTVYALDTAQGLAAPLPPANPTDAASPATSTGTGAAPRQPVSLAASLDARSTVVDAAGRFWAVEPVSGDVLRVDADGTEQQWRGAASPGSRLVTAGDRVVLVDVARRTVGLLADDATGEHSTCLGLRPGGTPQFEAGGSPDGGAVYVADSTRGVLLISSFATGDCTRAVSLRTGAHRLGAPVTVGTRVFVPDYTSGAVHVVDAARNVLVASPAVLPGTGTAFELFPRDGLVFYNDPGSERAGVIKPDGSVRPIMTADAASPAVLVPGATANDGTRLTAGAADSPADGPGKGRSTSTALPPSGRTARTSAGPLRISVVGRPPFVAGRPVALTVGAVDGRRVTDGAWTFGDGPDEVLGVGVTHTWAVPGTYRVTASATLGGRRATTSSALTVVAPGAAALPPVEAPLPPRSAGATPPDATPAGPTPEVTTPEVTTPPASSPAVTSPAVTTPPPVTVRTPARPVINSLTDVGDGQSVTVDVTFGSDTPTNPADVATISWGSGTLQVKASPGANTYTVGSLAPGTLTFTVQACTSTNGCGAVSAPRTVTVAALKQAPGPLKIYGGHGGASYTPGGLVFTLAIDSAGTGSISSVTVELSGGTSTSKTFPLPSILPVEIPADFSGLPTGVDITAVATVCNTAGKCATSAPTTNRAYAAPVAPAIKLGRAGQLEMIATWDAAPNRNALMPEASGAVTILDEADGSVVFTCPGVDLSSSGICHIGAGTPGRTYRAKYVLTAYPLSDSSVSGTVVR